MFGLVAGHGPGTHRDNSFCLHVQWGGIEMLEAYRITAIMRREGKGSGRGEKRSVEERRESIKKAHSL